MTDDLRTRMAAIMDAHYGGWIDNGKTDACRCPCGYRPTLGDSHSKHVADALIAELPLYREHDWHWPRRDRYVTKWRPTEPEPTEEPEKVCAGFQWVGQSFASCDGCGQPYWEHDYDLRPRKGSGPFDDDALVPVPISAEDKAACRARWGPR